MEAVTFAIISINAMMDYIEREKIQPPNLTDKEIEEELKNAKKLLENL